MKKIFILITLCVLSTITWAQTHFYSKFAGSYTGASNRVILISKIYVSAKEKIIDTFIFSQNGIINRSKYRFNALSYTPNSIQWFICDSVFNIKDSMYVGGDWSNINCEGQKISKPFKGNYCSNNLFSGMGNLCIELFFNYVNTKTANEITQTGGHYLRTQEIHCDPTIPYIDPVATLFAPCKHIVNLPGSKIKWYEKKSLNDTWTMIATGDKIVPAEVSWKKGTTMFNVKRWYKSVVDTCYLLNAKNVSSEIYGPFTFYLNQKADSVKQKPVQCGDTFRDFEIYIPADSLHQTNKGIEIYVIDLQDVSGKNVRWKFTIPAFQNKIGLANRTGELDPYFIYHPLYNGGPSTFSKKFKPRNGKYLYYINFTPWNVFSCKVAWDTIVFTGSQPYKIDIVKNKPETCPGLKDGELIFKLNTTEKTDKMWFKNKDSQQYQFFTDSIIIKNAVAGKYNYVFTNNFNCQQNVQINVNGNILLNKKLHIDTQLCDGQKLFVNATDAKANSISISNDINNKVINSDTFTIIGIGNYFVCWSTNEGCTNDDTIRLNPLASLKTLYKQNETCMNEKNGVWHVKTKSILGDSIWMYHNNLTKFIYLKDTLKFNQIGAGKFNLLLKNKWNCMQQISEEFTTNVILNKKLKIDSTICYGQKVFVNAKYINANKFELSNVNSFITNKDTFTLYNSGKYFAIWYGDSGCKSKDTIVIKQPTQYKIKDIVFKGESCPGKNDGIWKLEVKDGVTTDFMWYKILGTNSRILFEDSIELKKLTQGKFQLLIGNKNNCAQLIEKEIPGSILLNKKLKLDTIICNGQNIFVNAFDKNSKSFLAVNNTGDTLTKDTFTVKNSGIYYLQWKNDSGCINRDTIKIKKLDKDIHHDFLVPNFAFVSDTVYAVDHSKPKADKLEWFIDKPVNTSIVIKNYTQKLTFKDTGIYRISTHGNYYGCGFWVSKDIKIVYSTDTSINKVKYGYNGPLIQSFSISPNAHNGINYKAKVKLREKSNITIYKIDIYSGEIIGDVELFGKDEYEFNNFKSYSDEIYLLKVIAKNESKVIKVVVIK